MREAAHPGTDESNLRPSSGRQDADPASSAPASTLPNDPYPRPTISSVAEERRVRYAPILDRSFDGWYRSHARRTLRRVEWVRGAQLDGRPAAVSLLSELRAGIGYVYYIAVDPEYRRRGIGGFLLDDALVWFRDRDAREALAAVESDNQGSRALFASRGFDEVSRAEFDRIHGFLRAVELRTRMVLVPGELLLRRPLANEEPTPTDR